MFICKIAQKYKKLYFIVLCDNLNIGRVCQRIRKEEKEEKMTEQIYTREQVAQKLQTTPATISKLISEGRLAAFKLNGWRITETALENYIEEAQKEKKPTRKNQGGRTKEHRLTPEEQEQLTGMILGDVNNINFRYVEREADKREYIARESYKTIARGSLEEVAAIINSLLHKKGEEGTE